MWDQGPISFPPALAIELSWFSLRDGLQDNPHESTHRGITSGEMGLVEGRAGRECRPLPSSLEMDKRKVKTHVRSM
jgi:hypothetical protein